MDVQEYGGVKSLFVVFSICVLKKVIQGLCHSDD